jgi:hypothetical protein
MKTNHDLEMSQEKSSITVLSWQKKFDQVSNWSPSTIS